MIVGKPQMIKKSNVNKIQKIQHHIFECPNEGLMQEPKHLRLANNSTTNKIIITLYIYIYIYYTHTNIVSLPPQPS